MVFSGQGLELKLWLILLTACSMAAVACADENENGSGVDADSDFDSDTDTGGNDAGSDTGSDSDTDAADTDLVLGDDACPDIDWGEGFQIDATDGFPVGSVVPNWVQQGYVDRDGDNIAEETEVRFDLCFIHKNTGKKSIFFILGDTT